MGKVVVLGSLVTDLVARAARFPLPGESLIGEDFETFNGGKGLNQAVTAARLGANTSLIGHVGMDAYGEAFFPALATENVDSTYVTRDPKIGTGIGCVTISTDKGQNTIVALPRANMALPPEAVEKALDALLTNLPSVADAESPTSGAKGVFLTQCEMRIPTVEAGLQRAHAAGLTTILNAAPIPQQPLEDSLFALVDILIVNEVEATLLSGITVDSAMSAKSAAERLLARGPRNIIITLGPLGSTWCTQGANGAPPSHRWVRAFPATQVDATAAGDSFCGALAARLAEGAELEEALRWAAAAGAIAVSRRGALTSLPTRAEMEALL